MIPIHWHNWKAVAVEHYEGMPDLTAADYVTVAKEGIHPKIRFTRILESCECGRVRVNRIEGTWSLAQIQQRSD